MGWDWVQDVHSWPNVWVHGGWTLGTWSLLYPLHLGFRWALGGIFWQMPLVETSGEKAGGLASKIWVLCPHLLFVWIHLIISSASYSLTSQLSHRGLQWEDGWEHAIFPFSFLLESQFEPQSCFAFLKLCSQLQVELLFPSPYLPGSVSSPTDRAMYFFFLFFCPPPFFVVVCHNVAHSPIFVFYFTCFLSPLVFLLHIYPVLC